MKLAGQSRAAAAAFAAAAALLGAGGGAAAYAVLDTGGSTTVRQVTVAAGEATATAPPSSVAEVAALASASVVEITVEGAVSPFGGGGTSQGSGFVYDRAGHVITNQHVVGEATTATVRFADGSTYDAEVVGADESTDIAVLSVDAPARLLQPLELADSAELAVGDAVVAIGSPFGLEQTVTSGIVSALHRQISAPNGFAIDDAIQTDAAINHGNSGGPLLDLSGRVVGVNSQIESESGGNDGVGFAVPSSTLKRIADALVSDGSVAHAYLGVSLDESDDPRGAAVADVRNGTPADRAGLRAGDVVTAAGGETVAAPADLRRVVDGLAPGDALRVTVLRGGETLTLEVELGARPTS